MGNNVVVPNGQPVSPLASSRNDSFVRVASNNSSASSLSLSTGIDREKEQTVEFIVRVFNKALQTADADDAVLHQSDSEGCDEEVNDVSTLRYLNKLASIGRSQPSSAGVSEGDSKLLKIISLLNAAKLRSLNKHPTKKPDSSELQSLLIAGNQKPDQRLQNRAPSQYQQDFPELSAKNQPSRSEVQKVDSVGALIQKLNLNETSRPPLLGDRPLDPTGVSWKPTPAGASTEPNAEEAYRQAGIEIEKGKCLYCKLSDSNCVLKCSNCPLYFCNGQGEVSFHFFFANCYVISAPA